MAQWKGSLEVMVNREFWKDRKVFLTGHTGFKGGWLSLWLQSLGAKVTGYALAPITEPNFFNVAGVADGMSSVVADIRDLERLNTEIKKASPEVVIHMAAQPLVLESYKNPVDTYSTNVMGTVNLLESVRATPSVRSVVIVTSDKCYENKEWPWGYRENEPVGGHDPYSNSKGCAELVTAAYTRSFFAEPNSAGVASGRAGNVIGGGDWAENRIVPDAIRALSQGQAIRIRNPHAIRPWQHVLEPLSGYLVLAEKLFHSPREFLGGWNFGPGDEGVRTVEDLSRQLIQFWSGGGKIEIKSESTQPHEAHFLKLDCSKARHFLRWHATWNFEQTAQKTMQWYQAFYAGEKMRAFSVDQISHFEEMARLLK